MSEWWSYRLSDFLLFSPRTYYRLFELYNLEIWPGQLAAIAGGVAILALLRRDPAWSGRVIAAILAAAWLFVAWAFHLQRYATINWAATYFALGFAVQSALLLWAGIVRGGLRFRPGTDIVRLAGLGIFLFALAAQPLIGPLLGRGWRQAEIFGIAPDPTTLATLGLLLLAERRGRWVLLPIPLLWAAIGGATLWTMQAPDALVMPAAAVLALALAAWRPATGRGR